MLPTHHAADDLAHQLRARFQTCGYRASLLDEVHIEQGERADYRALSAFHYKSSHPGAVTSIVRMTHRAPTVVGRYLQRRDETRVVGILVRSLPHLCCRLRNIATENRYAGMRILDSAALLNREVRCISRVVLDPQWRGLGLAVRLVRYALEHPEPTRPPLAYTEALAAMGRVSPFFERAGMVRYERPLRSRAEHARLLDAMNRVGLEPPMLASRALVHNRLQQLTPDDQRWFEAELRRWRRAAGRTPRAQLEAMSLNELLLAARDMLMVVPVYYLFRHVQ